MPIFPVVALSAHRAFAAFAAPATFRPGRLPGVQA